MRMVDQKINMVDQKIWTQNQNNEHKNKPDSHNSNWSKERTRRPYSKFWIMILPHHFKKDIKNN
jgi:hypothetical protein